ncbi:hypothetical protein OBBRIDRAFT_624865 [Obba rivulosa]|uniref:Uncharacterized protein n=1 Tax=Obba rivulosa TaxID=1052685 RepID=A0A8E2DJ85_9APHY|nr:hypothetical protein OBBRIDRAFT_624865 [Obba rivulosa]
MNELYGRVHGVAARNSGGVERVQEGWDTWSGRAKGQRPRRTRHGESIFEHLPAPGEVSVVEPPSILPEMRLFNQNRLFLARSGFDISLGSRGPRKRRLHLYIPEARRRCGAPLWRLAALRAQLAYSGHCPLYH